MTKKIQMPKVYSKVTEAILDLLCTDSACAHITCRECAFYSDSNLQEYIKQNNKEGEVDICIKIR